MGALPSTCITYSRYEEPATGRELKLSLMAWLHQGLPKQKAETQQLRGCSAGALWACVFCVCMPLCVPCGSQDSCHPIWHLLFPEEMKQSCELRWILAGGPQGRDWSGLLPQLVRTGHAGVTQEDPGPLPDSWTCGRTHSHVGPLIAHMLM